MDAHPVGVGILRAAVGTFAEAVAVIGGNRLHDIQILGGDLLGDDAADIGIAGAELAGIAGGNGGFIAGTDPVERGNQTEIFRIGFEIFFRRDEAVKSVTDFIIH